MSRPTLNVPAVDSVLETLRRGQRQLARDPRGAIELAVNQLLSLGRGRDTAPAGASYRIDDLALAVEDFRTTSRPRDAATHVADEAVAFADALAGFHVQAGC
jgi:hypothetical protein